MTTVVWSSRSLKDVERLYRFLKSKNPRAAREAASAFRAAGIMLGTHPEIGRPVDGMSEDSREWLIEFGASGYVMLYRYNSERVTILAIRTCAKGVTESPQSPQNPSAGHQGFPCSSRPIGLHPIRAARLQYLISVSRSPWYSYSARHSAGGDHQIHCLLNNLPRFERLLAVKMRCEEDADRSRSP